MCCNIITNETCYAESWSGSGERHATREAAIEEGFEMGRSDDFNIGVFDGERLVSIDWMEDTVDDSPEYLAKVAEQFASI
jgi:hypothetical protein